MNASRIVRRAAAAAACSIAIASFAHAGVTLVAEEIGGDVIFSGGGTLDHSLWTFSHNFDGLAAQINSAFVLLGGDADVFGSPDDFDGPSEFTANSTTRFADSNTGDVFGIQLSSRIVLVVPDGYTAGDPLSGSMTFEDETFDSLGMEKGIYTWSWAVDGGGRDFFKVKVIIPAPGAAALLCLATLALPAAGRRRGR